MKYRSDGINRFGNAEKKISEFEARAIETHRIKQNLKNKRKLELQDNFDLFNVYEITVPEGEKGDKAQKKYLKKYQQRNF